MSDLQILLISIGVLLIVLVLLYNGWQDWRVRRRMRQSLPSSEQDILMQPGAGRREPGLHPAPSGAAPSPDADGPLPEEGPEVDAACEAVIDLALAHPVSGELLADALQGVARVGKKPVRVLAEREGGGHRTRLQAAEHYVALQLAVVLANRAGPLTAIEWSQLWTIAQNLAEHFEGVIEAPDQDVVLQRAVALDERCAAMDAQVGLILQLAQPLPLSAVVRAAAESGFVQVGGRWVWLAENGIPRFHLQPGVAENESTHRVDLILDVPNSLPDDQAFSRMLAVGRDLATHLDAQVLDDQGRVLQDRSAAGIDQQISALYDQLDQAGFLAGTERAARVFS